MVPGPESGTRRVVQLRSFARESLLTKSATRLDGVAYYEANSLASWNQRGMQPLLNVRSAPWCGRCRKFVGGEGLRSC